MLSNKEIVCPNNLLDHANKKRGVNAAIVNAGLPLPMLSVQDAVKEGFVFLDESTPDWFANCIYISISASFGYRVAKGGMGMIGAVKKPPQQPKQKVEPKQE